MADQIEINYEVMQRIKAKFAEKSQEMERLNRVLENHIGELRAGGWIGNGANSFYNEMDQLLMPSMVRLSKAFAEAENSIQMIVGEFEAAEEEAKSLVDFQI
jgi:WXG100 family type VII secretion target